jgi:hypothetical protein
MACSPQNWNQKKSTHFKNMPIEYRHVVSAWNPASRAESVVCIERPCSPRQPWHDTATIQWRVMCHHRSHLLRAHVHYEQDGAGPGYKAVPGRFWISGVATCEGLTPAAVVQESAHLDPEMATADLGVLAESLD